MRRRYLAVCAGGDETAFETRTNSVVASPLEDITGDSGGLDWTPIVSTGVPFVEVVVSLFSDLLTRITQRHRKIIRRMTIEESAAPLLIWLSSFVNDLISPLQRIHCLLIALLKTIHKT